MTAHQDLPSAQSSSVSLGRASTHDVLGSFAIEALLHQALEGDQDAWTAVEQCLGETVQRWLYGHPSKEAACYWESEEHYVALAFERFRQAAAQRQVAFETLATVLAFLRASLNGAILETLRVSSRPEAVSSPWPDVEECPGNNEVWDRLQARLSNRREQRLTYLLYHCGLEPGEIVRCYPQEWSDVHEVACLRRIILARLTQRLGSP